MTAHVLTLFFFFGGGGGRIQFNVPFKFISAHMRRANQKVGRKRVNPEKNHLAHPHVSHVARAALEPPPDTAVR